MNILFKERVKLLLLGALSLSMTTCKVSPPIEFVPVEVEYGAQPKNVVLMIGDGMGLNQITAAIYNSKSMLNFEKFPIVGFQKTFSGNNLVTDSAAGATAMSCGIKTYNGAVGMDMDTLPCTTIIELAEDNGLATGVVVTSTVVHATPGAFVAHQPLRGFYEGIALDYLNVDIDFVIGGGQKYFDRRAMDQRNLYLELEQKGYQVYDHYNHNLFKIPVNYHQNFFFFTANNDPLPVFQGRRYLPFASKLAVNFLKEKNNKGFFLMVESSQIDWAGHQNEPEWLLQEMADFDKAIGEVLEFATKDRQTLVIVTADHETGGLSIADGSKPRKLEVKYSNSKARAHTGTMVPVLAFGPGAEKFRGIYDNTQIFHKVKALLNLEMGQSAGSMLESKKAPQKKE